MKHRNLEKKAHTILNSLLKQTGLIFWGGGGGVNPSCWSVVFLLLFILNGRLPVRYPGRWAAGLNSAPLGTLTLCPSSRKLQRENLFCTNAEPQSRHFMTLPVKSMEED